MSERISGMQNLMLATVAFVPGSLPLIMYLAFTTEDLSTMQLLVTAFVTIAFIYEVARAPKYYREVIEVGGATSKARLLGRFIFLVPCMPALLLVAIMWLDYVFSASDYAEPHALQLTTTLLLVTLVLVVFWPNIRRTRRTAAA